MSERRARGRELRWRAVRWVVIALLSLLVASLLSCAPHRPWTVSAAPQVAAPAERRVAAAAEPAYVLAQGSIRLVSSLKTTLQIDAYVPKGVPRVAPFVSNLTDLLAAYQRRSNGKLKFRLIEANTYELREQAKREGLSEQPFAEEDDDKPAVGQGFLGLVFKYGDKKSVIPQLSYGRSVDLEFWITNTIRAIRNEADNIKHRIGVVTDKDELKLSDANLVANEAEGKRPSIQGILTLSFPYYQFEEVGLKSGSSAIDPDLVGLIITQPRKDYTAAELHRIDDFLMLGEKALVVYASAVTLKPNDPSLLATLSTHGLDTLLDGYGIHMNKDAVFDDGAQFRAQVLSQSGQPIWLRHCGMAHVLGGLPGPESEPLLDNTFAAFFHMNELMFPFASSLELARDKQPAEVRLAVVARSTPAAWIERTDTVDMKLREQWMPRPPLRQRILAAYAQGKLRSAFAGQPGAKPNAPSRAPRSSRVLVVSSSLFLTNPFAYAGNAPSGTTGGDPNY
jgi:ABC-type uncharacterized transport system involved in gliding motility auxiliary subunit